MAELFAYHGFHVAQLLAVHETITWHRPAHRTHRVRVSHHSCECRATIFELCHAAGQAFVRKTTRGSGEVVTQETAWLLTTPAERLYQQILLGEAR